MKLIQHTFKTISGLFIILSLFSCSKENEEKQADYFIKFYGSYYNNYAGDVISLDDGGYIIIGTSETEETDQDLTFIRTDRFGNRIGEIIYSGLENDDFGLCIDESNDGFIIGGYYVRSDGNENAYILEMDINGNQIGEMKVFDKEDESDNGFYSLKRRDDNKYIAAGYVGSQSLIAIYDPVSGLYEESTGKISNAILKSLIFKTNDLTISGGNEGNLLNILHINEAGNYYARNTFGDSQAQNEFAAIIQASETNLILISNKTTSGIDYDIEFREIEVNYNGSSVISVEEINLKEFSGSGSYVANDIVKLDNGNYAMLVTKTYAGDDNILLYILDSQGTIIGEPKEFGGSGDQIGVKLLSDEKSIIILGMNAYEENSMIALIKTDYQGNIW